jgi:hypothetical protein
MAAVRAPVTVGECLLSGAVASKLIHRIKRTEPSLPGASELERVISDAAVAITSRQITRAEGWVIYRAAYSKLAECEPAIRTAETQLKAEIRRRLDLA